MTITWEMVARALEDVCDPCSLATGTPLSIVDLGLVAGWSAEGGRVRLVLCTTGPGCTFVGHLALAARDALARLPGVVDVEVSWDPTVVWDRSRMTAAARATQDARRAVAGGSP